MNFDKNILVIVLVVIIAVLGGLLLQTNQTQEQNNETEKENTQSQEQINNNSDEQSSITLLSPNGGEKWKIGSKQIIKWSTQNIPLTDKIAIHIRKIRSSVSSYDGQECDPVIFIELKNDGKEDWVISEYPEGNYIIEVVSYESIPITKSIKDESDTYFSIVK